jgi:hypothetical protein
LRTLRPLGIKDGYAGLNKGLGYLCSCLAGERLEGTPGRTSVVAHHIHGCLESGYSEARSYGGVGRKEAKLMGFGFLFSSFDGIA